MRKSPLTFAQLRKAAISSKVNCLQRISMKRTSLSIAGVSTLLIAASLGGATASDMATKAPPPMAVTAPVACSGLWDFLVTSCPLSWYGITIYGTVDGRDLAESRHTL